MLNVMRHLMNIPSEHFTKCSARRCKSLRYEFFSMAIKRIARLCQRTITPLALVFNCLLATATSFCRVTRCSISSPRACKENFRISPATLFTSLLFHQLTFHFIGFTFQYIILNFSCQGFSHYDNKKPPMFWRLSCVLRMRIPRHYILAAQLPAVSNPGIALIDITSFPISCIASV